MMILWLSVLISIGIVGSATIAILSLIVVSFDRRQTNRAQRNIRLLESGMPSRTLNIGRTGEGAGLGKSKHNGKTW